jgi:hypothetical protein
MSSVTTDALINRTIALLAADIPYVGIGTGVAPTTASTKLPNEASRKLATLLIDGNTIVLDGFWDETEANGVTYTNAGAFGNGATNSSGSGQLDVGGTINVVKDNTQSLTVSIEILVEAVNI